MINSKLFQLINSLDEDERYDFEAFLKVNKSKILSWKLYLEINKIIAKNKKEHLNKRYLHGKLYPKKTYNDINIRFHISQLNKLIENYIFSKKEISPLEKNLHLLEFYRTRNLTKLFQKQYDKTHKELVSSSSRNQHFFFKSYQIENENQQFISQNAQTSKRHREKENNNYIQALDKFYILSKLKQICSEINYQQTFQQETVILLKDEIILIIETNKSLKEEAAIAIYYSIYQTLIEAENTNHFKKLKTVISKKSRVFNNSEAREIYIFAQNYCIRKVNNGQSAYLEVLFELYMESTEKNLIYENNKLSPWDYKNIISLGLRLQKLNWTLNFIETEKEKIENSERENAYSYNLANYYFSTKDYNKAIQLLLSVEYIDVFYQLGSKTILIKSYYELDEFDALFSLLDSFKILIQRKKDISKTNKTLYTNFIALVKRLISGNLKNKKQILIDKIANTKLLADRKWLLEKLGEV